MYMIHKQRVVAHIVQKQPVVAMYVCFTQALESVALCTSLSAMSVTGGRQVCQVKDLSHNWILQRRGNYQAVQAR